MSSHNTDARQTIERLTLSSYSACVNTENIVIKPGSAQIDVNFVNLKFVYGGWDAFTDIGWFLYISLDSYKVWMHLQTLVGFCTYLLILIRYRGCIYRHWLVSVHIS